MTQHDAFITLSERFGTVQMHLMKLDLAAQASDYEVTDDVRRLVNDVRAALVRFDAALHTYLTGR